MSGRAAARLLAAGVAFWAFTADAFSQGLSPFLEQCFARTYDGQHLAEHPGQDVTAISIEFISYGEELGLGTAIFETRNGRRYAFSGECRSPENKPELSCIVCSLESCEQTKESFRIVGLGAGTSQLYLYNDRGGITATEVEGTATRWLDPNGEHRVFRLDRTDMANCAF